MLRAVHSAVRGMCWAPLRPVAPQHPVVRLLPRGLGSAQLPARTLTHTDANGKASMVDVSSKDTTKRTAVASAVVQLGPEVHSLVKSNSLSKGDVLTVAQLAGIMGAKQTSTLIPLCHPLPLQHVGVTLTLDDRTASLLIVCSATTTSKTGVEMEALTGATVAALTVYDMCKAASKTIVIGPIQLASKAGGASGDYLSPTPTGSTA